MIGQRRLLISVAILGASAVPLTIEEVYPPSWDELWRPQFHLSTPAGWGNDPNGLVYDGKRYHVFYQHSPYSTTHAPMHWRWASSEDLFSWEDHGVAIEPRGVRDPEGGDPAIGQVFSGQAVLDVDNKAGFGEGALVLIWTDHTDLPREDETSSTEPEATSDSGKEPIPWVMEEQRMGYMLPSGKDKSGYGPIVHVPMADGGINNSAVTNLGYWTRHGKPSTEDPAVVEPEFRAGAPWEADNRDPKMVKVNDDTWILALANCDRITFYSSTDLKTWNPESSFGVYDRDDPRTSEFKEHDPECDRDVLLHSETQMWGIGGLVWECPDLFTLPVMIDGQESATRKHVLVVSIGSRDEDWIHMPEHRDGPNQGSATMYFVGDFTQIGGKWRFMAEESPSVYPKWIDYGPDNYAGVTFYDHNSDGDRIFQAWMSNWIYANKVPTFPWRSGMTLARKLHLHNKGTEASPNYIVTQEFLPLTRLRAGSLKCTVTAIKPCEMTNQAYPGLEIIATFETTPGDGEYLLRFDNGVPKESPYAEYVEVGLKVADGIQTFFLRRSAGLESFSSAWDRMTENVAPRKSDATNFTMHAVFDVSSAEVLFDHGEVSLTGLFFPRSGYFWRQTYTVAPGGAAEVQAWQIKSSRGTSSGTPSAVALGALTAILYATSLLL